VRPRYGAGVAASLVAELVFILATMPVLALLGRDIWAVVRMPAALVAGPAVMQPPGWVSGDIMLGLAMHAGLAVLVGVLYAMLLPRVGVSPIVGGLIAGAVLYVLGFLVLPAIFPQWLAPFRVPPLIHVVEVVMHAVYGVVFGWTYDRLTFMMPDP